jgi:hypothetical protein
MSRIIAVGSLLRLPVSYIFQPFADVVTCCVVLDGSDDGDVNRSVQGTINLVATRPTLCSNMVMVRRGLGRF